jgi:hypothetical protein
MFENLNQESTTTDDLCRFLAALSRLHVDVSDAERVDQIRLLEEIKAAAAAAQIQVATEFARSQRGAQTEAGVPSEEVGRGIASQVALAKRESPARARRFVGWAGVLTGELPNTFLALQRGRITEWRAQIVARETAWLSAEDRGRVDAALAPRLELLGDRALEGATKTLAYQFRPARLPRPHQ